jgi:hypothetical protein
VLSTFWVVLVTATAYRALNADPKASLHNVIIALEIVPFFTLASALWILSIMTRTS